MMALIQKDFKRLLSYHAISQVGYIILGIGTALPVGIIGGAVSYVQQRGLQIGLFYTAGSVERQAGTTDLKSLAGLGRRMPVTMITLPRRRSVHRGRSADQRVLLQGNDL